MLKVDPVAKTLTPLAATSLNESKILERAHLQEAILRSWEAFILELGFEELFLVGAELVPHESCRDRVDLLALSRDGTPVVFELKRHRDRLQLLQAISYAAMISKWDTARFRHALGTRDDDDTQELRSLLDDEAFELGSPEIVLVAESFDPEVILSAEWLSQFGVPITVYAISAVEHRGDTLLSIDQRYPLPGVDDVYVSRNRSLSSGSSEGDSWDEVVTKLSFPFAKRAADVFRKRIAGSPHRRQFDSIYAQSPLGRMRIAFKTKYLRVYTTDQSSDAEAALRSSLEPEIEILRWGSESTKNSGFTFIIETEAQFERFLAAVGESGA